MPKERLIAALAAHVDAGKTTLSEAMLFLSGTVRKAGRVDHGDTFLDTDPLEKERGITIFSKQAELMWDRRPITLVDTPGHADFSGETERALRICDLAVLVISAAEGVQSHTLTLWRLLEKTGLPVFFFVNKCDRPDVSPDRVLEKIREELTPGAVPMAAEDAMEQAALCDETALDVYLREGTIHPVRLNRMIRERKLFPVFFGSALKAEGVEPLLDAMAAFDAGRVWPPEFGARVYKIARDPSGARLTFLKVTGGVLKVRDLLTSGQNSEKAAELRFYSGVRYQARESCPAGEICAVLGLTWTESGMGIGREEAKAQAGPMLEPVFTCRLIPEGNQDIHRVLNCLRILEEEEPLLGVTYQERTRQIQVQSMGEVQLEVLRRLMKDRFGIPVSFGESTVLYRETIASQVEGVGHYEPLRHYAEVHLLLRPLPRGSGLRFSTDVPLDDLAVNWQRLILTHMKERVHRGVLTGSPITDMHLILCAGKAHLKHTEGGDFRQATYRAIRQGLMKAESVLLEPWVEMRLELPEDCLGRAMADAQAMGGSFGSPEGPEGKAGGTVLRVEAPARQAADYPRQVQIYTRGRGRCALFPAGYRPCPDPAAVIREIGYDPERDVENTPDSVFCSHGAGTVVSWRDTEKYMHLPLREEEKPEAPAEVYRPRPVRYLGTEEEDRELQAIFERTYGPGKTRDLLRSAGRQAPAAPRPAETVSVEKEYLLVDGYNIMFAWDELKAKARESIDFARQELMDVLCNYRGVMNCEVILVFDAYKVRGGQGSAEKYRNIYVVYTREAQTADSFIEKLTFENKGAVRIRVATSDGPEQAIILGNNALRVSAREFRQEVMRVMGDIAAFLERNNARVPDRTVEKVYKEAWVRMKQNEKAASGGKEGEA